MTVEELIAELQQLSQGAEVIYITKLGVGETPMEVVEITKGIVQISSF